MRRGKATHRELVDPANERLVGTLTPKGWAALAILEVNARMCGKSLEQLEAEGWPQHDATNLLVHIARQSSGAINGEHRKDLVNAIRGGGDERQLPGAKAPPTEEERGL